MLRGAISIVMGAECKSDLPLLTLRRCHASTVYELRPICFVKVTRSKQRFSLMI